MITLLSDVPNDYASMLLHYNKSSYNITYDIGLRLKFLNIHLLIYP